MSRICVCGWLLLLGLAMPLAASAQVAYTTQPVNVRAGPDSAYPQVARLHSGTPVNVIGCLDDWRWCDVVVGQDRGWVYAKFLSYPYQNRPVPIYGSGAYLGLPLVTFSVGPYWDNYYRGRPWYHNRPYWVNRPAPYYRPPPPPYRPPNYRPPPPPRPPPQYRPPPSPRPLPSPGMAPPSRPYAGTPPTGARPPSAGVPPPARPPTTAVPPAQSPGMGR